MPADLPGMLRAGTRELHTRAERHPVQSALVRGQASTAAYVAYLRQLRHLHVVLEAELARRAGDPVLAPVDNAGFRAALAQADLEELGAGSAAEAVATLEAFSREAPGLSSLRLLGMHYVLEGSTNGGRFIARAVRGTLPADAPGATRYLDPHGDAQAERWGEYCRALGRLPLGEGERREVVAGAEAMFRLIIDVFDAIECAGWPAA